MPGKCGPSGCTEPYEDYYVCSSPGSVTLASTSRCFSRPSFPERLCTDGPRHAFELNFCEHMFAYDIVISGNIKDLSSARQWC